MLRDAEGRELRLVWEGDGHRRRPLPAQGYVLLSYRIWRGPFLVSGSGKLHRFALAPGEVLPLHLPARVRLDLRVISVGASARILLQARGPFRYGVSVYREGRRIPLPYRYLNHRGEEAARGGVLDYG